MTKTEDRRLPKKSKHKVYGEGVYIHVAECECWLCADPVKIRFATPSPGRNRGT